MNLVHAQKRYVTDTVADARITHLCPKLFIALAILAENPDVAETGNASVAAWKMPFAQNFGPNDQFDFQAAGLPERYEIPHVARVAFVARATVHLVSDRFQCRGGAIEIIVATDFAFSASSRGDSCSPLNNAAFRLRKAINSLLIISLSLTALAKARLSLSP